MGFNSATGRAEITAVAGQTQFDFVFKIYTDEDIDVWLTPVGQTPDDTTDLLVLHADYEIVVNGDNGGKVTLTTAASAGDSVDLIRHLESTRDVEYQTNGELRPEILNADQDYQTYLIADVNAGTSDSYLRINPSTLQAWIAEAEAKTADSYANEPHGVFVKLYYSLGDGTFDYHNSTDYSSLHWSIEAEATVGNAVKWTDTFIAAQGQTAFVSSRTVDRISVYLNGSLLTVVTDYDATFNTVTLVVAAELDDTVTLIGGAAATPIGGDVVAHVETVGQLSTFDPNTAPTVIVREEGRGGTFNYDVSQAAVNDGGTIFDGWVRQYSGAVDVKWFDVAADGVTDDTAKVQAALNLGGTVFFGDGTEYSLGKITVATQVEILGSFTVKARSGIIGYPIVIVANKVKIEELNFVADTIDPSKPYGIQVLGYKFTADLLTFTASGASNVDSSRQALSIGDGTTFTYDIYIKSLSSFGYDYPYAMKFAENIIIDSYRAKTALRGMYIQDCSNVYINSGYVKGNSTQSVGNAGENAILIESAKAHNSTNNIYIKNMEIEETGEHGIRIGGQYNIDTVVIRDSRIKRSGSGEGTGTEPDNHGGCGIKALGATSIEGAHHKNITISGCTIEGIHNIVHPDRLNFSGIQMGKVEGLTISDCKIVPEKTSTSIETTYSSRSGIELIGCKDVAISNCVIDRPLYAGILLYSSNNTLFQGTTDYWSINENITINGCLITDSEDKGIMLTNILGDTKTQKNITIKDTTIENAKTGIEVQRDGSFVSYGYYESCSAQLKMIGVTNDLSITSPVNSIVLDINSFSSALTVRNRIGMIGSVNKEVDSNIVYANTSEDSARSGVAPTSFAHRVEINEIVEFIVPEDTKIFYMLGGGAAEYAHFWARTTSPASIPFNVGSSVVLSNTDLSGIADGDGKITIGIQQGKILMKNGLATATNIKLIDVLP